MQLCAKAVHYHAVLCQLAHPFCVFTMQGDSMQDNEPTWGSHQLPSTLILLVHASHMLNAGHLHAAGAGAPLPLWQGAVPRVLGSQLLGALQRRR